VVGRAEGDLEREPVILIRASSCRSAGTDDFERRSLPRSLGRNARGGRRRDYRRRVGRQGGCQGDCQFSRRDGLERLAGGGELGRRRDKGGRRQRMQEVGSYG
jgi:hypothetical protein